MSNGSLLVLAPIGGGVSWTLRRARPDLIVHGLESTISNPLAAWADAVGLPPSAPRADVEHAVRRAVDGALVAVDDAELLDDRSFELLLEMLPAGRVIVGCHLGSARGRERATRLSAVLETERAAPLGEAELIELIRRHDPEATEATCASIIARSSGLPGVARSLAAGGAVAAARLDQLAHAVDELEGGARSWLADVAALPAGTPANVVGPAPASLVSAGFVTEVGEIAPALLLDIVGSRIEPDERRCRRLDVADRCTDPVHAAGLLCSAGDAERAREVSRAALANESSTATARARLMVFAAADPHEQLAAVAALLAEELAEEARLAHDGFGAPPDPVLEAAIARQLDRAGRAALAATLPAGCAESIRHAEWLSGRPPLDGEPRELTDANGLDGERWRWQRSLVGLLLGHAGPAEIDEVVAQPPATTDSWRTTTDQVSAILRLHRSGPAPDVVDGLAPCEIHPAVPAALVAAHRTVAHADLGRSVEAAAMVADGSPRDAPIERALRLWARAEAELHAGHPRRAARIADEAVELDNPAGWFAALAAAWGAWEIGEPVPTLSQGHAASHLRRLVEAELAAIARFDEPGAAESFDAVARGWAGHHLRGELRAAWAAAEVRRRQGEREAAVAALRAVEERAEAAGLAPLVQRVRRSLRLAGVQRRGARRSADGPLSTREHEVLELVASGLSTRDIAVRLGLAESTVETQVTAAMHKLGARTRLQAATMYRGLRR